MTGRKQRELELAAARAERARVEEETARQAAEADAVRAAFARRTPAIESTVQYLTRRQRRNGFGSQLALTYVPRRP